MMWGGAAFPLELVQPPSCISDSSSELHASPPSPSFQVFALPPPLPPAKAYCWGTPALDPKTNSEMNMAHPFKGFLNWKVGLRSRGDQGGRLRCGIYKVEVKRV